MRRLASLAALVAIAAAVAPFHQQPQQQAQADSLLEARTSEVASQLRCPVCQGLSIQESPSDLSQQMRAIVRDQLKAGRTPEEVKVYFVSKYGEWILLEPTARGFNLLVYALPALLVVCGLGVIVVAVRKWTRSPDVVV